MHSAVIRIIVDEAHSPLQSKPYRPKMQALVHLRQVTVPKILLTATLVPGHEQAVADAFAISLERTLVLRSPTTRPNHRLQFAKIPPPHDVSSVALQLASLLTERWEDDQAVRGIIFVRSFEVLEDIASSPPFPIHTYHGRLSDQQKDVQLTSWLSGERSAKWMVSTTALLHGVDYSRVDAVIFLESPFGLYDFVQGAGRAGRSGQESFIAVLHSKPPSPMPNESQYGCRAELVDVLKGTACRRASISKTMDGVELCCSDVPNSLVCDICEGKIDPLITKAIDCSPVSVPTQEITAGHGFTPRSPPRPPPTTLSTGFTAQAEDALRKEHAKSVKLLMERFGGCFTCRIVSPDHDPCHSQCGNSGSSGCSVQKHTPYSCTKLHYKNGWMDWKKTFKWPTVLRRCFFCGFPAAIVQGHDRRSDLPGICQFSDTALVAAWHVLHSPQLFKKLQTELGFVPGVDAKSSFAVWLLQYGSLQEDIRLLSVFSWLCRQYYPNHFRSN